MGNKIRVRSFIVWFSIFLFSGCTIVFQQGRRSDLERIKSLEDALLELKDAKNLLEKKLAQEIADKQVRVKMEDKGLVITFVAEVLFDSGKAKLRQESLPILDKVVSVLNNEVRDHNIGIEGHTDNEPIKYSGWKSNWELSAHRALSVLHYLESQGVSPNRLSAIGYGEYRPVVPNDTPSNKQLNRRVEIVIIPKGVSKVGKDSLSKVSEKSYKEELK
ncbi:MAG: OmpA family protein [Candidatus Omnitrophica bacterium]|nr:OmpA family protein [Candidatus Omnitrophota bacterium]MCM8823825.1 OmpA family protein [Candidatus Omnitrophota bacterium]MCM8826724.1 OmpA family protein [Candidatus Omnitrophota bacterium]